MVKVRESLVGRQFDRLTVVEQVEDYVTPKGTHHANYLCKCNCCDAKYVEVKAYDLKRGGTRSCGCFAKEEKIKRNKKYNDYEIQDSYVIMYTTKGEPFLVDLEDFWKVKDVCWHTNADGYFVDRNSRRIQRLIVDCPDDMVVDHINHDIADNRKENLRIVTPSQNQMNSKLSSNNTSGVTGVYWVKKCSKWNANIKINNKYIHLGNFTGFDDAVKARKEAEQKYFGEYSYSNSQMFKEEINK